MYDDIGYADAKYFVDTLSKEEVYNKPLPPLYNAYGKWCEANGLTTIYEESFVGLVSMKFNCHFAFVKEDGNYKKVFLNSEAYSKLITEETTSYLNSLKDHQIDGRRCNLVYSDYSFWCQDRALDPMPCGIFDVLMFKEKGCVASSVQSNDGSYYDVYEKK